MSWLGWLIIAVLAAAVILVPPLSFRWRGYWREVCLWIALLFGMAAAAIVITVLIALAAYLIRGGAS